MKTSGYMEYEKLCKELDRKTREACEEFKRGMEKLCNHENPVPWDWSTTPPWLDCIIQGPSGNWYLCESIACAGNDGILFNGSRSILIPPEHSPKWSGDWKLSKTMRPKEVAK